MDEEFPTPFVWLELLLIAMLLVNLIVWIVTGALVSAIIVGIYFVGGMAIFVTMPAFMKRYGYRK